ncbi:MAG TPA: family 10 glycosylhydrolase [Myxococcota bacterium]
MPRPTHIARMLSALVSAGMLACGGGDRAEPAAAQPARRGLWVLAEGSQRVLEHPDRIPALIATARSLAATDLFVQVYRGGRAWYETGLADDSPFRAARDAAAGADPLAVLLREAHAAGLRVHAWVNVLSLSQNRDAPLLRDLGRDAVLVDQHGRSLLDYPDLEVPPPDDAYYRMGTPALYLDPAAIGLSERLAATFAELVARHPELDGLHLDYIRLPDVLPFAPGSRFGVGLDFGHSASTRALFRDQTGLEAPQPKSSANAEVWDAWRRDRVTALVAAIRSAARAAQPKLEISAAVIPYADRAYLSLFQDWRRWLEDGLLEFAVAMVYTRDDRLLRYQTESFAGTPLAPRIWLGLGSWIFAGEPARAVEQIRIAQRAGARADALFSYDAIVEAPALAQALAQPAAAGP